MQSPTTITQPAKTNVQRVLSGDYTGMNFAGLARLSFEVDPSREYPGIPTTGLDINNREEQVRVIREHIESRGGRYVYTYDEPDTSAWKKKRVKQPDGSYKYRVVRPVYEGALEDLKRGVAPDGTSIHGMVVSVDDRLTRDQRHMEDAIEVVEHFDKPIIDVSHTLDLLTEAGRDMARVMVTMNGKQSAATARRLRDSHLSRALRGIPVGGTRPFGWEKDKRTLKKSEARLIHQAALDLLAGIGAHTIVKKWNDAGIRTSALTKNDDGTTGGLWCRRTFVLMMTNPRMAGIRTYGQPGKPLHEHYLIDETGKPIMGQWEKILTMKMWQAVVEVLAGPDRPGAGEWLGKLSYLCSTLIRCGVCAGRCSGQAKENNRYDYACKNPGCGKVAGSGIAIDKLITALVLEYLAGRQVAVAATPWAKADELAEAFAEKSKLLAQFNDNPDMGSYIWPKIRKLDAAISQLIKERAAYTRKTANPTESSVVERWDTLELEQQRAVVAEVFEVIILKPATRASNRFDPARLQPIFHQE